MTSYSVQMRVGSREAKEVTRKGRRREEQPSVKVSVNNSESIVCLHLSCAWSPPVCLYFWNTLFAFCMLWAQEYPSHHRVLVEDISLGFIIVECLSITVHSSSALSLVL